MRSSLQNELPQCSWCTNDPSWLEELLFYSTDGSKVLKGIIAVLWYMMAKVALPWTSPSSLLGLLRVESQTYGWYPHLWNLFWNQRTSLCQIQQLHILDKLKCLRKPESEIVSKWTMYFACTHPNSCWLFDLYQLINASICGTHQSGLVEMVVIARSRASMGLAWSEPNGNKHMDSSSLHFIDTFHLELWLIIILDLARNKSL